MPVRPSVGASPAPRHRWQVLLASLVLAVMPGAALLARQASAAPPGGGESIGVSVPYSGAIACADKAGAVVTDATEVRRGDTVFCTVSGLRPGQRVSARFAQSSRPAKTASAGADGVAALDFRVPATGLADGPLKVSFADPPTAFGSVEFALVATDAGAGGAGSAQAPGGTGADAGAGAGGASPANGGSTALTGLDVVALGGGAVVLLGGGTVLTMVGRRRRAARVTA